MSNMRKTFWIDAANAGAIMGLALVAVMYLGAFAPKGIMNTILSLLDFVVFVGLIYYFAKRRSMRYGSEGFSFSQSIGFIITTMMFTGILYGIGYHVFINYIRPGFLEEFLHLMIQKNAFINAAGEAMLRNMLTNPVFWMFTMVLRMVIYGGIVGLIVSAFVKRAPDIFADTDDASGDDTENYNS